MLWFFLILFLIILPAAALYGTYRFVFYSLNKTQNDDYHLFETVNATREELMDMIRAMREIPFESVQIKSRDGLTLYGRYYAAKKADAPLAICCHGYRGTPNRDFSGGARLLLQEGFQVLLIEERAHKRSEGHTITFGVKEREDVMEWIRYVRERFGEAQAVILVGISMGGGTVLMTADQGLPENVRGIIADCPFTAPPAIIRHVAEQNKIPGAASLLLAKGAARLFGGFKLDAADASEAVKHSPVPILLIHGDADTFVPCTMSRQIRAAAPDRVSLEIFPGAQHGMSFVSDPERYRAAVESFLEKCGVR